MSFVDFHCHLDLYPNPASEMAAVSAQDIYSLTVTTTPRAWPQNLAFAKNNARVRVALGLHPQLIAERAAEIKIWEQYLPEAKYIGEVGIDGRSEFNKSLNLQKEIFKQILIKCAEVGEKIITVHSVRSASLVLNFIEKYFPSSRGVVVLHWFTGSPSEARRALDLGCYFSINPAMLTSEKGRVLVNTLPHDRLLTETDGPFTMVNNRKASPKDVITMVDQLAILLSVSKEEIRQSIFQNLCTITTKVGDSWVV